MKLLIIDMHDIYTTWIIKNFVLFQIVTGRWYRHSYIFFLLLHFHKGIEFCLQFFVYPNFSLDFLCTDFCSNTPTTTASLEQHSWISREDTYFCKQTTFTCQQKPFLYSRSYTKSANVGSSFLALQFW